MSTRILVSVSRIAWDRVVERVAPIVVGVGLSLGADMLRREHKERAKRRHRGEACAHGRITEIHRTSLGVMIVVEDCEGRRVEIRLHREGAEKVGEDLAKIARGVMPDDDQAPEDDEAPAPATEPK